MMLWARSGHRVSLGLRRRVEIMERLVLGWSKDWRFPRDAGSVLWRGLVVLQER